MTPAGNIHIGTSGWSYKHWRGRFYPEKLPATRWLEFYVQHFHTIEVNNSYYRWPADAAFASWAQKLPDGFLMTIKAPGALTHYKRLSSPDEWIARMSGGLARLEKHFGVLLVQLSANFSCNLYRLSYFLAHLPAWIRVAVEFRHPSWNAEGTYDLLGKHGAAYCIMSGAQLPCILKATAPFVYVRMHGPDPSFLYRGSYSDADLRWWAERAGEWKAQGREVFFYFNNDGEANAVFNAQSLRRIVEGKL